MMKRLRQNVVKGVLLTLLLWLSIVTAMGNTPLQQNPFIVNTAAYAAMAAYTGETESLPGHELEAEGFHVDHKMIASNRVLLAERPIDTGTQYVISIAGTESKAGLKRDLNRKLVPFEGNEELSVHRGFYELSQMILKDEQVQQMLRKGFQSSGNEVIIAGHSLGGAAALLMGAEIMDGWKPPTNQLAVISFGAPVPGNDAFLASLKSLPGSSFEIEGDLIPRILQIVSSGYDGALPIRVKWKSQKPDDMLYHSMPRYMEEAQRQAGLAYDDTAVPVDKVYYIALPELHNEASMPESVTTALKKIGAHAFYRVHKTESVVDETEMPWAEALQKAKKLGYSKAVRIVLVPDVDPMSKTRSYTMKILLTVYDATTGKVLSYNELMMNRGSYTMLPKTMVAITDMARK